MPHGSNALLKYNGLDWLHTISVAGGSEIHFPTPYVSRQKNISYQNEQQVESSSWTMNGSFYISKKGAGASRDETLKQGRASLIDYFRQNFKKFESDQGTTEMTAVKSVNFEPANYAGLIPYSIILEEVKDISGENVSDIVDTWGWTEAKAGFSALTHTVSAKGLMPGGDTGTGETAALWNAKDWVRSRVSGQNRNGTAYTLGTMPKVSIPLPAFIDTTSDTVLIKISETENINRMAASYSVTENFQFLPSYKELPSYDTTSAPVPHVGILGGQALSGEPSNLTALIKWGFDESDSQEAEHHEIVVTAEVYVGKDRVREKITHPTEPTITKESAIKQAKNILTNNGTFPSLSYAAWYWARQYGGGKERHAGYDAAINTAASSTWGFRDLNLYHNNLTSSSIDENAGRVTFQFKFDDNKKFRNLTWTNFIPHASGTVGAGYNFNGNPVARAYTDPEAVVFDYRSSIGVDKVTGVSTMRVNGNLFTDPTLPLTKKVETLSYWIANYRSEAGANSLSNYLWQIAKEQYALIIGMHQDDPALNHSTYGNAYIYERPTMPNLPAINPENAPMADASSTIEWVNPIPASLNISLNKTQGTASISASFVDEDYIPNVRNTTYNIRVNPQMRPYLPRQSLNKQNGSHIVFDPGGDKREHVSVSVQLEGTDKIPVTDANTTLIEDYIIRHFTNKKEFIKESDEFSKTEDEDLNVSSSFSFSFRGEPLDGFYDGSANTPLRTKGDSARNVDQQLWPI